MARFSAIISDSSDEDIDYEEQQPAVKFMPSTARSAHTLNASRKDNAQDYSSSDSDGSQMDEDELTRNPSRRRRRDKNILVEGPDGQYYHPHELGESEGSGEVSDSGYSEDDASSSHLREPGAVPWAQRIGVDPQKLHVMQASLFRTPEEAETLRRLQNAQPNVKSLSLALPDVRGQVQGASGRNRSVDVDMGPRDVPSEVLMSLDMLAADSRPERSYPRVEAASSFVCGAESAFVDAGLAFGRSFRAGWGPGGSIVHVGRICGLQQNIRTTGNTSIVTKSFIPVSNSPEAVEILSTKLLPLHLSKSPIAYDPDGVPFANPSEELHFAAFADIFPAADHSFEALLFRLGHALFDDLDLHLHSSVDAEVRNRVYAARRKAALSDWLESAVAPAVDAELQGNMGTASTSRIFTLLTGNQIEKAVDASLSNGDVRLATLISQAGGDAAYRGHLLRQLDIWQAQRADNYIDDDVRRIYGLLAGLLDVVEGSIGPGGEKHRDVSISHGLDWKRVLGLHLWFAQPLDVPISTIFDEYERHRQDAPERTAAPQPHYLERSSFVQSRWIAPSDSDVFDALYNLIRLYSDPTLSLSSICDPRSFSPSPADYTLPWHLYILVSRCMRIRDFDDRDEPTEMMEYDSGEGSHSRVEGHSPSADLLASSYAHQLEELNLIQEAVFVLLHIESSVGREKAIKDLLLRSAPKLDDWMIRGLAGSLKVPLAWINEAMATYHLNNGLAFEAYQSYLQGGLYSAAHEIAVLELAPEAVVRDDMTLLRSLFERIDGHPVNSWHVCGKAYLDYATIMVKLPGLRTRVDDPSIVPDASDASELDELVRTIPKLLGILPDLLRDYEDPRHRAALSEMTANLARELDLTRPRLLSAKQLRHMAADEGTKLRHLQVTVGERFLSSLQ